MAFREIKIRSYDFKYTLSKQRIVWCKNVYNGLSELLPIVKNIKWDSYVFNDNCNISYINQESDEEETKNETMLVTTTPNNSEDAAPLSYTIFGGSTYELINKKHYKTVNLRDFMDPTGDADIKMKLPFVYIENPKYFNRYSIPLIDQETNELNNYFRTTFRWCYDQVYEQLMLYDLNKLFPNSVPFNIDEYDEVPNEFKQPNLGFIDTAIGNCRLISFYAPKANYFKIQFVIKIADEGITKIDHLIEFVFSVGEKNEIIYQPESTGIQLARFDYFDEYRIDTMPDLLEGNIEAYAVRQNFFVKKQSNYYHKGFNHILRMIYLLELSIYVDEYQKYKRIFFNSLIQKFSREHIINKILFPEKEDPELLKKILLTASEKKEKSKYIYENLHIYFYKLGSDNKMKLIKINISDFLEMYQYKLVPSAFGNVFSGELIKKDEINRKYNIFIKKIKETVKKTRTRKFHRTRNVSSVKSEGPASSRRQKTPEIQLDSGESELFSFSYTPNIAPPPSPSSSRKASSRASLKRASLTQRKNKSLVKNKSI
jgi:hypothetical protein